MLPLYTCYSASHTKLFELMSGTAGKFDLRPTKLTQRCAAGSYKTAGWGPTMLDKLAVLVEACLRHEDGSLFVYSDVDVVYNTALDVEARFVKNLGALDLAAQYDGPGGFCAGLFIARGSPRMTAAWRLVRESMTDWASDCDQTVFNCLNQHGKLGISVGLLISATSLGAFNGFQRASRAQDLVNDGLKDVGQWAAFHASWVIGTDEKHSALRHVLSRC